MIFGKVFLSLIYLVISHTAYAQTAQDISIILKPEYPDAGEVTEVSLQSYSKDLRNKKIQWYLDDVLLVEGVGLVSHKITAPNFGEEINLIIKINNAEQARKIIRPNSADILWEADTYVPEFYKGKALPVDSSEIKAIAKLNNEQYKDKDKLYFNWYRDGYYLTKKSGRGKDTIILQSPGLYDDYNLSVKILNEDGIVVGQGDTRIANVEPELLLYFYSPLIGAMYSKAFPEENTITAGNESIIYAVPYYFSIENPLDLEYKWDIRNAKIFRNQNPALITVIPENTPFKISAEAIHKTALLQTAETNVIFKTENNNEFSDENFDVTDAELPDSFIYE